MKTIVSFFPQEAHSALSSKEKEKHTHIQRMRGVVCSTKGEAEEGRSGTEEGRVQCVKFARPLQKNSCEISP